MSVPSKNPRHGIPKQKRGVILLIVVSLLTLLAVIGVVFVLYASRANDSARVGLSKVTYEEPPENLFNLAVGQLLYDTLSRSSLKGHSLLGDVWGHDFVAGMVVNIAPPLNNAQWGGQAFAFQFTASPATPASPIFDYYTGRVITFIDGPAAGHSTRILQYSPPDPANNVLPQLYFETIETALPVNLAPNVGNSFLINGAPFNGAGAGFDDSPAALNVNAVYANAQSVPSAIAPPPNDLVALLPHFNGYDPNFGAIFMNGVRVTPNALPPPAPNTIRFLSQDLAIAAGGPDEPWDAADFQTMFLAMHAPATAVINSDIDPLNNIPVLPSYHRPELVHYWVNFMQTTILSGLANANEQFEVMARPYGPDGVRNTADEGAVPYSSVPIEQRDRVYNLTRCSIFRPMPWDHPNFTGSNPALTGNNWQAHFNVLRGSDPSGTLPNANFYDVDNDNDGLPDSIWIDLGFPVVTKPDGKRYKPLFAFMVQDLDGRINLNTHGNLAQVARTETPPGSGQYILPNRPQFRVQAAFGLAPGLPVNTFLPRGVGFGPAEVDFLNLLIPPTVVPNPGPTTLFAVDPTTDPQIVNAIVAYDNLLRGRYTSNFPLDQIGTGAFPGMPTLFEALNAVKHMGVPNDYANPLISTWYASPPDVWGRGAAVLDWGGQPLFAPFAGVTGEMVDNPYELSLSGEYANSDSRYTPVEIERMLRYHDFDSQRLLSRPLALGGMMLSGSAPGIIGSDHTTRQRLAGMSSSIPAPAGQIPATQILASTSQGQPWRNELAQQYPAGDPRNKTAGNATILDMYREKIRIGRVGSGLPATDADINAVFYSVVPWEFRRGGKFDLNRWLGNGADSLAFPDRVGDDPVEAFMDLSNPAPFNGQREAGWEVAPHPTFANIPAEHSNGIDVNNDGVVSPADRMLARQLYARHLYCLATMFIDPTFDPLTPHEPTLQLNERRELYLRRIAQWAINVVDHRDSDSIITPFEYDANPWNGWDVDSNLATDGSLAAPEIRVVGGVPQPVVWPGAPPDNNERRLVWGVEQPELLLNETLAFHSRGVKDTAVAGAPDMKRTDPMTTDDTLDQFRVPQGSLFIEVYCPRAYLWQFASPVGQGGNQKPRLPQELYDPNGFLQLGRLAPGGRPVWRLALSPLIEGVANAPQVHPQTLAGARADRGQSRRESASFDWQDTSLLTIPGGSTPPVPIAPVAQFRYAYFGNASALPANELAQSFHNTASSNVVTGAPFLQPGGYAVIGPRALTYLGSCDPVGNTPIMWDPGVGTNGYSNQRIEMDSTGAPNVFNVFDTTNTQTTRTPGGGAGNIRNVISIIADYQGTPSTMVAGVPTPWTRAWTSGLNITEPLMSAPGTNYYPEPLDPTTFTTMVPTPDPGWYDDPDPTISLNDGTGFRNTPVEGDDPANTGRPIFEASMQDTGTFEDVSSVYLERLANPNLPWNPLPADTVFGGSYNPNLLINPYITVDWSSIDVTVMAGDEDTDRDGSDMNPIDPDDQNPSAAPHEMAFRSRQRSLLQGYPPTFPPGGQQSPWSPVTANTLTVGNPYAATPPGATPEPYFKVELSNDLDNVYTVADRHTFGYLNAGLGFPAAPQPAPPPPPPNVAAYLGEAVDPNTGQPAPFPWLVHLDRPLSSPMELLMVPASSPGRLTLEFTPGDLSRTWVSPTTPYDSTQPQNLRMPFGHLLNFFHTEDTGQKLQQPGGPQALSPHLNRLFDYVEVPSPYAGAERWFNPGFFGAGGLYRPPFNKLSRFRDAGRININTIFDEHILISAMGHFPGLDSVGPGSFADKLFRSRQGYGGVGTLYTIDPNFPTIFSNPFRPLDAADLMPDLPLNQLSMRKNGLVVPPPPPGQLRAMPVEATFLRSDPDLGPNRVPLVDQRATAVPPAIPDDNYRNTDRNAYFRYQALQKMGNTFTTQSNVYAVWLTIGYFEVEDNFAPSPPNPPNTTVVDAGHPDGLRLGAEIGADSGEIVRHRFFCIIDRSIPVGYAPPGAGLGKLNSENCILLKRMIE